MSGCLPVVLSIVRVEVTCLAVSNMSVFRFVFCSHGEGFLLRGGGTSPSDC